MADDTPQWRKRMGHWRYDSVGRVLMRYQDEELLVIWADLRSQGLDDAYLDPAGAEGALLTLPLDGSSVSEAYLRVYELLHGYGEDAKPVDAKLLASWGLASKVRETSKEVQRMENLRAAFGVLDYMAGLLEPIGIGAVFPFQWFESQVMFASHAFREASWQRAREAGDLMLTRLDVVIDDDLRSGRRWPRLKEPWTAYKPIGIREAHTREREAEEALIRAGIPVDDMKSPCAWHDHVLADDGSVECLGVVEAVVTEAVEPSALSVPASLPDRDSSDKPAGLGEGLKTWVGYLSARSITAIEWEREWAAADDETKYANDPARAASEEAVKPSWME